MTDVFVSLRTPCWCPSEGHQHGVSLQSSINLGEFVYRTTRQCQYMKVHYIWSAENDIYYLLTESEVITGAHAHVVLLTTQKRHRAEKKFVMPGHYVWVIGQVWGQDGWILAKFFFCVFMDRVDEVEVHKLAKKERGQYPAILTEQTWSTKDLLYGFWWNFACGIQRERARWLHLARSGSQSQRAIWFILPARGASHIIKENNARSATNQSARTIVAI